MVIAMINNKLKLISIITLIMLIIITSNCQYYVLANKKLFKKEMKYFKNLTVKLKVEPSGDVNLELEGIIEIKPPRGLLTANAILESTTTKEKSEGTFNLNMTFGFEISVYPIKKAEVNIDYSEGKAQGNFLIILSAALAGEIKSEGKFNAIKIKGTNFTKITLNITSVIPYSIVPREQIEKIVSQFEEQKSTIIESFSNATCGYLNITEISLTPTYESDKAKLDFHIVIEGDFEKASMCYSEKVSEKTGTPIGFSEEFLNKLRKIKYSKFKDFIFKLYFDRDEGILKLNSKYTIVGDVNKQFNEIKNLYSEFIEQLVPNATSTFYDFCKTAMRKLNVTTRQIKLIAKYETKAAKGLINFKLTGLKLKLPINSIPGGFKFYSFFDSLSKVLPEPISNVTLIVEPVITQKEIVEIEIPPHLTPTEKGPHKVVWNKIDFNQLKDLIFKVSRNVWGVANAKIHEIKVQIAGIRRRLLAITNSTLKRFQLTKANKLEIEVEGIKGARGAMNITLPKEIVKGIIIAYIDGNVFKPLISANNTHYFIYITYMHSTHNITIRWGEVELTINANPTSIEAGSQVTFTGELSLNGEALSNVPLSLYVDNIKVMETKTKSNGSYEFKYKFEKEGEYECKVVLEEYNIESNVQKIIVKARPPIESQMLIYGVSAVIAIIAVIIAVLLVKRRT